jgi:hypothetical protein
MCGEGKCFRIRMKMKAYTILILILILAGAPAPGAHAQTEPQVILSWRAKSFVPPGYPGKALAIAGTDIAASLDVLQKGKLVNLSSQTLYWYVNNQLVARGKGALTISFRAPEELRGEVALRVEIPSFAGGPIVRGVNIPIVRPEVVIEAPFPSGKASSPVSVRGTPYFFNISDPLELLLRWTVNGEIASGGGDPTVLTATVSGAPASIPLSIGLTADNPESDFEVAQASVTLTIK